MNKIYLYTKDKTRYYLYKENLPKDAPTIYHIEEVISYTEGIDYDYIEYVYKQSVLENEFYFRTIFYNEYYHGNLSKYIKELEDEIEYLKTREI